MNTNDQNSSRQPPLQPVVTAAPGLAEPPSGRTLPKKVSGWKIFWAVVTVLSVLTNIILLLLFLGLVGVVVAGGRDLVTEEVIRPGPRSSKIAVIRLEGLIDSEQAEHFRRQLETARKDSTIKALIIRTNSPGGSVSGSDQIHNEIRKFRHDTGKPVIAFMQAVAASGAYYTSVACDKIMAEPTAITGSIGVIMSHFVLENLLEEKLGIQPVVLKSGEKKDWPSPFEPVTQEQQQYLQEKLIKPAYERFVELVAEGRQATLSPAEVRQLADGSIYHAAEAVEKKLIDQIGYIDEAIELAQSLAGIPKANVVEYRRPFSLADWLTSQTDSIWKLDRKTLQEFAVPELLYLWLF
jgi:protease-4